jgi:putative peptidoglycan lipid II flippase
LGALINAAWLWWGLRRQGAYQPLAGWALFVLQVGLACALLCLWLIWVEQHWDWLALRASPWMRIGLMGVTLGVSAGLYFGSLWAMGLKLRALLRR